MTIHIVARKNGVGIDRDVSIMEDVLSPFYSVDYRPQKRPESLVGQMRALLSSARDPRTSDLYLLTERIPSLLGRLPGRVALVPNQERFPRRHLRRLRYVDHVLCKTRHAEAVFSPLAEDVRYIGFTSVDRGLPTAQPNYERFFHLAGRSTLKGTEALLAAWKRHPEWPELTLVQSAQNAPSSVPDNVRLVTEFVADDVLQFMQNEHGIHLCPSLSEGWGHYIVEAMSCSAVVVTTDGPPMNELVAADRGVLVPWNRSEPRHLGTNWHVDVDALEEAVISLLQMPVSQRAQLGCAARSWYETNDAAFRQRLPEIVGAIISPNAAAVPRSAA